MNLFLYSREKESESNGMSIKAFLYHLEFFFSLVIKVYNNHVRGDKKQQQQNREKQIIKIIQIIEPSVKNLKHNLQ